MTERELIVPAKPLYPALLDPSCVLCASCSLADGNLMQSYKEKCRCRCSSWGGVTPALGYAGGTQLEAVAEKDMICNVPLMPIGLRVLWAASGKALPKEGRDPALLLSTAEVTPEVLCPVLAPCRRETI